MVNALFLVSAAPEQHRRLVESINKAKYPFEGEMKGHDIPHICETRMYEVRCKEETLPYLARDMRAINLLDTSIVSRVQGTMSGEDKLSWFKSLKYKIAVPLIRKILGALQFHPIEQAKGEANLLVDSWYYTWAIGYVKDIRRKRGEEL
jgi:hypothetical protein